MLFGVKMLQLDIWHTAVCHLQLKLCTVKTVRFWPTLYNPLSASCCNCGC